MKERTRNIIDAGLDFSERWQAAMWKVARVLLVFGMLVNLSLNILDRYENAAFKSV